MHLLVFLYLQNMCEYLNPFFCDTKSNQKHGYSWIFPNLFKYLLSENLLHLIVVNNVSSISEGSIHLLMHQTVSQYFLFATKYLGQFSVNIFGYSNNAQKNYSGGCHCVLEQKSIKLKNIYDVIDSSQTEGLNTQED